MDHQSEYLDRVSPEFEKEANEGYRRANERLEKP